MLKTKCIKLYVNFDLLLLKFVSINKFFNLHNQIDPYDTCTIPDKPVVYHSPNADRSSNFHILILSAAIFTNLFRPIDMKF